MSRAVESISSLCSISSLLVANQRLMRVSTGIVRRSLGADGSGGNAVYCAGLQYEARHAPPAAMLRCPVPSLESG